MAVAFEVELFDEVPRPGSWFIDAESTVLEVLRTAGLDSELIIPPGWLARLLGFRGRGRACPGCESSTDIENWILRVIQRGPEASIRWRIAHELGHVLLYWSGIPPPHDERLVDEIARRLWVRSRAIRHAYVKSEGDAGTFVRLFADQIPATVLFQRLSEEMRMIVILRLRGQRLVYAPDEFTVPAYARGFERRWVRNYEQFGIDRPEVSSIRLSSFRDPAGGSGIAIAVPQEAAEYAASRPWEFQE